MNKFWFFLWLRWASRVSLCSVISAYVLALFVTLYTYISLSSPELTSEVITALNDVIKFWFAPLWSLTLLLAVFRSLKFVFNRCYGGYMLKLYSCDLKDELTYIGYGDLVKVWRKWFMLIIWLVGIMMVLAVTLTYLFSSYNGVFEWFSIYWLYGFILISGWFSFMLLHNRCKKIKVVKC